jgi:hypothetical protein
MATEKRLIDARWLTSQMYQICEVCQTENIFIDAIIDEIYNAPDVDAVEVVHGRWIPVPSSDMMTGKAYKCSECGKMRYGSFMPNYCQNCGAKMDGDGNG